MDWGDGSELAMTEEAEDELTHLYTTAPTGPITATFTWNGREFAAWALWPSLIPVTPSNLQVIAVSGQEVRLTWSDNSSIEQGYAIEQRAGGGDFVPVAWTPANTTSWTLTGPFHPQVEYSFRVRAWCNEGQSGPVMAYETIPAVPEYPTDLAAALVHDAWDQLTGIRLTWQSHALGEEVTYVVQRSDDRGATWTTVFSQAADEQSAPEEYVDQDIFGAAIHTYLVSALSTAGSSGLASTGPVTKPTAKRITIGFLGLDPLGAGTTGNLYFGNIVKDPTITGDKTVLRWGESEQAAQFLFGLVDANHDREIEAAEVRDLDLRLAGYSRGGKGAVQFARELNKDGQTVYGYKLLVKVPVTRLLTIDPTDWAILGIPDVPGNVVETLNYFAKPGQIARAWYLNQLGGNPVGDPIYFGNGISGIISGRALSGAGTITNVQVRAQGGHHDGNWGTQFIRITADDVNHDMLPWYVLDAAVAYLSR